MCIYRYSWKYCAQLLAIITLDVSWQAIVKYRDIEEAIVRAEERMLYFNQIVFSVESWNRAFVLPFPLLYAVRNNGWLSLVWVTCSVSQGWTRWPCVGKRQAFEQEAHTGYDRCIVAWRLKPCLQSGGNFTAKFHCCFRVLACGVMFYCSLLYMQWLLVQRLL